MSNLPLRIQTKNMNKKEGKNSIRGRYFYITTTLPYVNAEPHVGHGMEFVRADVISRYHKFSGDEVFFNIGTDEHGVKIYKKAIESGKNPQAYVDEYAAIFKKLKNALNLDSEVHFIRTTDPRHKAAAQEFWKICEKNGYIYKKKYKIKYCVGCELEKTESELVNCRCPDHPNLELELIDEENYFFKFSIFQKPLLEFYEMHPDFVIPDFRFREIKAFVYRGLEDFSISRLKAKMPWGIEVPNNPTQVMYVWFDALTSYISTLGWPEEKENFEKFWINGTPTQYCGKDNLRQQSAMWQAMLMAAGISNSRRIIINGHFTGEGGIKMSKSLGNTINPFDIINEYGADAFRYFVTREVSMFEDSPFTVERFKEAYNANLANGLGNLVSRIMKMAETYLDNPVETRKIFEFPKEFTAPMENFELNKAMDFIWQKIGKADAYIQKNAPFRVVKENKEAGWEMIIYLVEELAEISCLIEIFLPDTASKIRKIIRENKMTKEALFPRKD